MSRAQRLLDLLQALRRRRRPVRGQILADELGISLRTLYRDIGALQAQGAAIEGEAGVGYILRPGFTLPPLMFTQEEVEALVLGSRWVAEHGDGPLAAAARNALARIEAVMPADRRGDVAGASLIVGPGKRVAQSETMQASLRAAIRAERKLTITYRDQNGSASARTIWPIALAYFAAVQVVVAWCELRQGFRHFRPDRIEALDVSTERYPRRRAVLLKAWEAAEGIAADRN